MVPEPSPLWEATFALLGDRAAAGVEVRATEPARVDACRLLAGAVGRRAIDALTASLDDASASVRAAALEALAASAVAQGGLRLAPAVFHRRADVRALAVVHPATPPELVFALLCEPTLRAEAFSVLKRRAHVDFRVTGAALRARRRGQVDDDTALTLVVAALDVLHDLDVTAVLRAVTGPPNGKIPTTIGTKEQLATTMAAVDDHLVDLLLLLASDEQRGLAALARLTRALSDAVVARRLDDGDRRRLAVAVAIAAAAGKPIPALIGLAATAVPAMLLAPQIDLEARRAALRSLARWPGTGKAQNVLKDLDELLCARPGRGGDVDLVALTGAMRLSAAPPFQHLKATIPPERLAESFGRAPCPALFGLTPTEPERLSYRLLLASCLAVVGERAQRAAAGEEGDDATLDRDALVDVLASLPQDGVEVMSGLLEKVPALAPGLLLRAIERGPARGEHDPFRAGVDDVTLRRRQRAITALVERCPRVVWPGLLRAAADALLLGPALGARAVVAAIAQQPFVVLAEACDAIDPARRARVLPIVVDEAPPATSAVAFDLPASETWRALRSRSPSVKDAPATVFDGPASSAAERALVLALAAPVRGLCAAALAAARPATPTLLAALLASHDELQIVDAALRELAPLSVDLDDATAIVRARAGLAALPLGAKLMLGGDDAVAAVDADLKTAPGGARGLVELTLSLGGPLGAALARALAMRGVRERAEGRPAIDPRADDLVAAIVRGDLLDVTDARRAPLASLAPPLPKAAAKPPAAQSHPTVEALRALSGPGLEAFLGACTAGEAVALARTALVVEGATDRSLAIIRVVPRVAREPLVLDALRSAPQPHMLRRLMWLLPTSSSSRRMDALRDVARWGARQGYAIAGRGYDVTFIADGLGHTRLSSRRVCVNPLPLLQGLDGGEAIVRGLIVHELGHHRYHSGDDGLRVWNEARGEHIHELLNLVADEHLERNLRAMDPARYGDPLKTLAAWAFQHMRRELPIARLLDVLGPRAAAVLLERPLLPGRLPETVVVDIGAALKALADRGSSFARFMRVLRMGAPDGRDEPRVAQALGLFPARRFRDAGMDELLSIARQLRAIFGDEVKALDVFDLHRLSDASADDLGADGVDTEALERAAEAGRQSPRLPAHRGQRSGASGRAKNTEDDVEFDQIERVERVTPARLEHRKVAATVRRPAEVLRRSIIALGSTSTRERRRLSGRRLDRTGLQAAVVRGDPRVLMSRRETPSADLFVGVLIDCSGSMDGDNLERAQHFAVIVAEAVRGLKDVDARFFGFTDEVIFDCGDARACAVTSLKADGGNNDAAGLAHAARVARKSRRKAVLLIMISDGAPTECSVAALRHQVDGLMARGVLCAQVAVEAISEEDICFEHHILLDDGDLLGAAKRFGAVMERLLIMARSGRAMTHPNHDTVTTARKR